MKKIKQTKAQLEKRRDEINQQLNRVNDDLKMELDRDMEEQATQVEQEEVSSAMEANLRTELNDLEGKLLELENEWERRNSNFNVNLKTINGFRSEQFALNFYWFPLTNTVWKGKSYERLL